MSLSSHIHESLPYIDVEPTADERAAALALIVAESDAAATREHPSLPPAPIYNFSHLILSELDRVHEKIPLQAIDLSRYESLERSSLTESETASWHSALCSTYVSQSYLKNRQHNLDLLDKYGKNAWLLGNSQLEDILKNLERELADKKAEIDKCVIQRIFAQKAVTSEIKGLEETWKRGVGAVLETEVAAEYLLEKILDSLRDVASS